MHSLTKITHSLTFLSLFLSMAFTPLSAAPSIGPLMPLPLKPAHKPLRFAIFADNTGGHRPGILEDAVAKANLLHPDFIIGIGDLVEGGIDNLADSRAEWQAIDEILAPLTVPFIPIPGNHDYANASQKIVWQERYGASYRAFEHEGVLFLLLNSEEEGYGAFGDAQLAFVKETLEAHPNPRWTFVFMHQPCWRMHRDKGWREIEEMLKHRPHTAFAGHTHFYEHTSINGRDYITLATTGGTAASGKHGDRRFPNGERYIGPPRGVELGEFDGITWITVPPSINSEPIILNLDLNGFYPKDISHVVDNLTEIDLKSAIEVFCDPVFTDGLVSHSETSLRLINKAPFPIRVKGTHQGSNGIRCIPDSFDTIVPPKTTLLTPFAVTAHQPIPATQAQWLSTWHTYMASGPDTTTHFTGSKLQRPALRFHTQKLPSPPSIDGSLTDWPEDRFISRHYSSAEPHRSFRFATAYDDSFAYLAIAVNDPDLAYPASETEAERLASILYSDFRGRIFNHNALEIRFTGQPDPARSINHAWHWFKDHLMIGFYPPLDSNPALLMFPNRLDLDIKYALVQTPTGYNAEIAIPIQYITQQQENWDAYRLNITIHDLQSDGSLSRYSLHPDWRSEDTISGSGTYFKSPK